MSDKRGVLHILSGPAKGERIKLRTDGTIFGREKADIVIADREISSTHFQVQVIDQTYYIFDMNSSNGTFVNGQRTIKSPLSHQDIIRAGGTEMTFQLLPQAEVRDIPTIYHPTKKSGKPHHSIVDTLVETNLTAADRLLIIKVTYGDQTTEILRLKERVTIIGRAASFGAFDQDPELSRKHLMIKVNHTGEIFVQDQGSTNGTFINDHKVAAMQRIMPEDIIRIGLCTLRIHCE